MFKKDRAGNHSRHTVGVLSVALAILSGLAGCATIAPALTSLAVAFGQDLIASASVNYAPRYAEHVEALLVAMAREGTGLPVEEQLAKSGYRPPSPDYTQSEPDEPAPGDGYGQGAYDDRYPDPYPEDPYYDEPYAGEPYPGDDPYAGEPYPGEDPYADEPYPGEDPYADEPYPGEDPYAGEPYPGGGPYDGEPYPGGDPYENVPPAYQGPAGEPPDNSGYPVAYGLSGPLTMEVAVLVRRAGGHAIEPIDDGAVLFDGAGDPARGDLLRFHVQVNRPSFVYVIGVDATGYVAQIFPDPDSGLGNPVEPGQAYTLPVGNQWWGLDQQTGVEHVYFIASLAPRPDIAAAARQLASQPRRLAATNYRPVRQPAVLPTRGLVKVDASPVVASAGAAGVRFVPERFMQSGGTAVSVTRWFVHETR